MRADLEDSYGAIDWAHTHLKILQGEFDAWLNSPPYLLITEERPEISKKLFRLEINRRLPPSLNAGVGAVINSIRSSLDILAATLAQRNGKPPAQELHFPIYRYPHDLAKPENEARRKKWFSDNDRKKIESLKPYQGGHEFLYVIHQLDIKRKHERLIRVDLTPRQFVISPEAYRQGFEFPSRFPGFKDGAVIGSTDLHATNDDFHIEAEITFNETNFIDAVPVLPTLRQFAGSIGSIIQMFE